MNYYETLYIIHPALESGRLKDIILSIQKMFTNSNLNIVSTDIWGKKKLAYLIDKQKYGTYVLVQFEGDGQTNSKIAVELEHNPNILSYLTSKINKENIQKDLLSLDEQISGTRLSNSSTEETKHNIYKESNKIESKESSTTNSKTDEAKKIDEDTTTEETINENSEDNHGTNK